MRIFLALMVVMAMVVGCNSSSDGYTISGNVDGDLKDSTMVFLKTTDSLRRKMIELDTAYLASGKFSFTGSSLSPELRYIVVQNQRGSSPIILENGSIEFDAHKDSIPFASISGTPQNDYFKNYLDETRRLSDMSRSMNEDFRKATMAKDTATVEALRAEYFELQEKAQDFELEFAGSNPKALVSVLILEKLLSGGRSDFQKIHEAYNNLSDDIKNTETGKKVAKVIDAEKATAVGSVAPTFSGPNPEGELLALNDLKGKLTLIDFWAAWCRPCRAENPNIVSVYNKYKDKGLNVVGVSLDRTKDKWVEAIKADGLEWNHISNLKYFQDPIARSYNIDAIPAAFLIDENGVIVAKNLRGKALEDKVAELLN